MNEPLGKVLSEVAPKKNPKETPKKSMSTLPQPFIKFIGELGKYEKRVVKLLKSHDVDYDHFMVVAENMVRNNPKLLNCNRGSLFGSILTAAEIGLVPNTPEQLSYVIPYFDKERQESFANFQVGYFGYVKMMYRNNRILKIMSEIVYENDQFDRYIGDDMNWHFIFKPASKDRGARKGVFGVIHIKDAEPVFKYLDVKEIEEIRSFSKRKATYDPKNDPQGWMWKKATIRQMAKLVPKGESLGNAVNIDGMIEAGGVITLDDSGNVRVEKPKEKKTSVDDSKLKTIFGDPSVQDVDIIDEKP